MRAAGRALGLSQPAIARRLAASFGGPALFDRLPERMRLSAAGDQLVPTAQRIEDAVLTLERRCAAASPALSAPYGSRPASAPPGTSSVACRSDDDALPSGITLELQSLQPAAFAPCEADPALRHQPPDSGDYYVAKLGAFAVAPTYGKHHRHSVSANTALGGLS